MFGHRAGKAKTVEECRVLDLGKLAWAGAFQPGRWGALPRPFIAFQCSSPAGHECMVCTFSFYLGAEEVSEPIPLETTPVHFGGVRWWGRCPLVINGRPCGRRVLKLYLPPGARYFGCRACHRLTYRSVQKHDARVDRLLKDPLALQAMMIASEELPLMKSVRRLSLLTDALMKLDHRSARRQAKANRNRTRLRASQYRPSAPESERHTTS